MGHFMDNNAEHNLLCSKMYCDFSAVSRVLIFHLGDSGSKTLGQ